MDIFCISGTEIAPEYIKSMPELCRKLISHLAFEMQYPAFPSGDICT